MSRAVVALGSNVGDRLGYLREAVVRLAGLGDVVATSSLYETDPVGGPAQDPYLNAVVVVETDLDPPSFLAALHRIEREHDRVRRERWGPRTLDLDLIVHGDTDIDAPGITVPHPRAHERRFVLEPASEVAPDALLADGRTVREALDSTEDAGVRRWPGEWTRVDPGLGSEAGWWVVGQLVLFVVWGVAAVAGADLRVSVFGVVGAVGAVTGGAILLAAASAMGPRISVSPQPVPGVDLVERGVYRFVRHPMYTGVVLLLGGAAVAVRSVRALVVTVVVGGFFVVKARREEMALAVVVPGYLDYMRRVVHRFVPGVL